MSEEILTMKEAKSKDVYVLEINDGKPTRPPVRRSAYSRPATVNRNVQITFENGKFADVIIPEGFQIARKTSKIRALKLYSEIYEHVKKLQLEYDKETAVQSKEVATENAIEAVKKGSVQAKIRTSLSKVAARVQKRG